MIKKSDERQKAIELRRNGKTYNEILKEVPVAKSTLSLWLREVGLSKKQTQLLTAKRYEAQKRGALARKLQRLRTTLDIHDISRSELGTLTKRDLFILGIALYWAEGTKEKEVRPGSGIQFANSDAVMVHLFIRWLSDFARVTHQDLVVDLYLHKTHRHRLSEVKGFWEKELGLPVTHVYYKRHNPKTRRLNSGTGYHGLVCLKVRSSSGVVRRLAGFTRAIIEQKKDWGMV